MNLTDTWGLEMSDHLPPLPEPNREQFAGHREIFESYDAEQMQEYAREAIKAQAEEIKDHERAYELLFKECGRLRANAKRWRFALIESSEWTYAVCKWDGSEWLPIKTEQDIDELDESIKKESA
jgi:hypothetical protein